MKLIHRLTGAIVLSLSAGAAWGQVPSLMPSPGSPGASADKMPYFLESPGTRVAQRPNSIVDPDPAIAGAPAVQAYAPEAWVYQQDANCCRMGGSGPIGTELYFRSGASFPIAGADFAKSLRTGFEVMGGGRTLFFTPDGMRAWAVDIGLSWTYNNGHGSRTFLFDNQNTTLRGLHRTALSLGVGHDWFIRGPGSVGANWESNWRFGIDGGGRWGTCHLDMNTVGDPGGYARSHDVYGGAFAALHLDWELPMGGWTFLAGVRGEWSYSFMDLLPGQTTNLHDINVLLTVGVRW